MAKRFWCLLLLLTTAGILLGCTDIINPTTLVSHPRLPGEQQELQQAVQQYLPPGAKLTVPLASPNEGAIRQVDLRGEGSGTGLIAFYKSGNSDLELGVLVLEKVDDKWMLRSHIQDTGKWVDRYLLTDLSGDGVPELLLGYCGDTKWAKMLAVYKLRDNQYQLTDRLTYVDFAVGDLGDGNTQLAVLESAQEAEYLSAVSLRIYDDERLRLTYSTNMDGYPDQITFGQATPQKKAFFVDLFVGAHSARTVLITADNGTIRKNLEAADEDDKDAPISYLKPYQIYSTDIDGDGLIEIGVHLAPPGSDEMAMVEVAWIEAWYNWDGEEGLIPVMQSFASYPDYRLILPERWQNNKVAIVDDAVKSLPVQTVKFSAYNPNRTNPPFLTILTIEKSHWFQEEAKLKADNLPYNILGENESRLLVAVFPLNEQMLGPHGRTLMLTAEELEENFSVLEP